MPAADFVAIAIVVAFEVLPGGPAFDVPAAIIVAPPDVLLGDPACDVPAEPGWPCCALRDADDAASDVAGELLERASDGRSKECEMAGPSSIATPAPMTMATLRNIFPSVFLKWASTARLILWSGSS